ncbi:hypothetical protein Poli38472_013750 [Pythium oligandrum]|uniref:Maleylacetoacetate isomerase n=1 Tax=Pythium oligandrum TaxID=41045 RepID=A0A8K1CFL6_PYTOL|nr:hypothetical protein Poli38472_013750 [Pythium oligandrum]|eukprot:TMW61287.1 hypothetical protein Poli38472_013750 [Pythium oligandrum]
MMGTNEELPVLCSYWQSSCSWRVRIGLAWKGIAYTTMRVLTDDGEFTDEYVQLNPSKRLPALIIDGHVLTQSASILEYLEETRPEKPLLSAEPLARARVRTICQLIAADIQPMQNLGMIEKVVEDLPKEEQAAKTSAWGKHWIHRGFLGLEQELARTAGKFCVGDSVTMADLFLVPQVYNANRFGVDMSEFPTIARISAELSLIPAFQVSHPSTQPGAQ